MMGEELRLERGNLALEIGIVRGSFQVIDAAGRFESLQPVEQCKVGSTGIATAGGVTKPVKGELLRCEMGCAALSLAGRNGARGAG